MGGIDPTQVAKRKIDPLQVVSFGRSALCSYVVCVELKKSMPA